MIRLAALGIVLCSLLTSCVYGCTAVFVTYHLRVVDVVGNPVVLDTLTVMNLETGRIYPTCTSGGGVFPCLSPASDPTSPNFPGYEIMNDGFNADLRQAGSLIRVTGTKGDLRFSEDYCL